MIPIKIDGKKYKIKPITDLTTKEFIELSTIDELDHIKYIKWQTGLSDKEIFFAVISDIVIKAIGTVPDITKLNNTDKFDYSKKIFSIGQRHQIEKCDKEGYDLLVYVLAVSQGATMDETKIGDLYHQYMDMVFVDVLPAGFFFFKILENGSSGGLFNLRKIKESIRTCLLKGRQALRV